MESSPNRCPDCGHVNPPGAQACESCNFPLSESARAAPAEPEEKPFVPLPPRRRPPRRRGPEPVARNLYIIFGVIVAASLVWIALAENVKRASAPIEGASENQVKRADDLRAALGRDSSNVEAHTELGNILYDTGNWSEAIIHYKAVLARDSTRVPVLVDLGVCYFNLGRPELSEGHFLAALRHDPHQPIAHFNMGIIFEQRKEWRAAFGEYHLALQADPPQELREAILSAMQRVQREGGMTAPPLDRQP